MGKDAIRADLDDRLLTDTEMELGEGGGEALPDPFPAWLDVIAEEHVHGRDRRQLDRSENRSRYR